MTDRETFLTDNAPALLAERDATIERLRDEVRELLHAKEELRRLLAKERAENARLGLELAAARDARREGSWQ